MKSATARRAARAALLVALVAQLAACGRDGTGPSGAVTEVVLDRDTLTLPVGETVRLIATTRVAGQTRPAAEVRWSSSDVSRATVDAGGWVRGVAAGTALVVATSGGGADTARVTVVNRTASLVEARALWVTRFEWGAELGPAQGAARIAAILEKARQARFNLVYFQVRGQGDAFYPSDLEPCAIALCGRLGSGRPAWDPLRVAIEEAGRRGLELHAWLNALSGFSAPRDNPGYCANLVDSAPGSPRHMLRAHPEWAVVHRSGARETCESSAQQGLEYLYVSPGVPAARTHLARVAADVARRYAPLGLKGIHLDRIRYPGRDWSHDSTSVRLFGRAPGAAATEWDQFRRERVSLAVREVHDSLRAAAPGLALSAAVWGIYDPAPLGWSTSSGFGQYFQDPREWARQGYLDVAVPMTYWSINAAYCSVTAGNPDWACLLDEHMRAYAAAGRHVYIGIAANRGAAEVQRQVLLGRQKGVRGFAVFSYTSMEAGGGQLWAALAGGAFAEPATVPPMGWK